MALIIPPGFLHAVYELRLSGDPELIVVTCGHEIDSGSGASGAQSADDLFLAFASNLMPSMSNEYTLEAVTSYVGQDGGPPLVVGSSASAVVGGSADLVLPQNCAYLVRKRTDAAGRRGRGRMYIPGVDESNVDERGNILPAHVAAWQTAFNNWLDDLTTAVGARLYPPVVLHRSEGIGVEPPPTPVTSFVVESIIATQRRRLRP